VSGTCAANFKRHKEDKVSYDEGVEQGSATYGTRATHGTPNTFQWHA